MGVALFDLLPEAMEAGGDKSRQVVATGLIALGFVIYMFAERAFSAALKPVATGTENAPGAHRGNLGGASLTLHSFLDGIGIGLAFQVSAALGGVMAIGVIAHDFSDGINTVHMVLSGGGKKEGAARWLVADALAPIAGIACTFFVHVSARAFGPILALFCGLFLYIGASELVPESHHRHPQLWTSCATMAGLILIYIAVQLAKI
jgi:zinc transporter ZupT